MFKGSNKFLLKIINSRLSLVVIFLRVASAVMILFSPLFGFIFFYIFDFFDSYIFEDSLRFTRRQYNRIDKYLDYVGFIAMLIVSYGNSAFRILLAFFIFRLVGQVIYMIKDNDLIFILFPNFFDALFFWFIILKNNNIFSGLVWFVLLMIFVVLREVWLHYFVIWYVNKHGYPKIIKKLGYNRKIIFD